MSGISFTEASGLNDSIYGKSQAPIKMIIETKAEAWEQMSAMEKIFVVDSSSKYAEKMTGLTAMNGFLPAGELGNHPQDEQQESYSKTIEHEVWKNKFVISREIMEDSQTIDLRKKPDAFIAGYYRTRESFAAGLLVASLTAATFTYPNSGYSFSTLGADGKRLFANDHPAKVSGADQSNRFTNAFSAAALGLVETAMHKFKGDNNEILAVSPDTIIIPDNAALKTAVFAAIGADKDPDTANNGFNYQFGRWNVIVWSYLNQYDDSTAFWIVMDSKYNETNLCAAWFDRVKLDVKSYIDEETDGNVWTGYSRFGAGFNDWRGFAVGGQAAGTTLS